MAAVGAIVAIAGVAVKIASDVQAANAERKAAEATAQGYDYDAMVATSNAKQTRAQTTTDILRMQVMARRSIGTMSAAYGASGVTRSGSAADVLADAAATAQEDADNMKRQGDLKVAGYLTQADFDAKKAFYYRTAGSDAGKALGFKAAGDAASAFPAISKTTNFGYSGADSGGGGSGGEY